MYAGNGLCVVKEIIFKDFGAGREKYYVLNSLNESSTYYVPVKNELLVSKMRNLLSADELRSLIDELSGVKPEWIESDSLRREKFKKIISFGNCRELIMLVRSVHMHSNELNASGRKLHISDESLCRNAQKLLFDEFSYVLGMNQNEFRSFIDGNYAAAV